MKKKITSLYIVLTLIIYALINVPEKTFALDTNWSVSVPISASFSELTWSLAEQESIIEFNEPVTIINNQTSNTGFTLQVSTSELIHETDPTQFIGYTNLEIKTGMISTDQPDGLTAPINDTYTSFMGALSTSEYIAIMTADDRVRMAGSWSITPTLRLTVPAKQKIGNYVATITFSLI